MESLKDNKEMYVREFVNLNELLKENLKRSYIAAHKKKDFNRVKRIGNSLGEVYQLVYKDGGVVNFTHIDGRWTFNSMLYDLEYNDFKEQITIISDHALERYRCRMNMYAAPIEKVLFDIAENFVTANYGANNRFPSGYALGNNGCLFVTEQEAVRMWGRTIAVKVIKTVLDQPDRKIDQAKKDFQDKYGDVNVGKVAGIVGDRVITWTADEDTEVMINVA